MIGLLFIAFIMILTVAVCKNNFKKRTEELTSNLKSFNEDIKKVFYSIPEVHQEKLLNLLNKENQANLKNVLSNNFIYGSNAWSIQQQILKQQELVMEINNLKRKDLFI